MSYRLTLSLVYCLIVAPSAHAQGERLESLQGVRKVEVVVTDLSGDAADLGHTSRLLRTHLEEKLLEAGLEVSDFAVGFLQLDVKAHRLEDPSGHAVHLELSFHQPAAVSLNRWMGPAETWSESSLLVVDEAETALAVSRQIERLVEAFLVDWRTANS